MTDFQDRLNKQEAEFSQLKDSRKSAQDLSLDFYAEEEYQARRRLLKTLLVIFGIALTAAIGYLLIVGVFTLKGGM